MVHSITSNDVDAILHIATQTSHRKASYLGFLYVCQTIHHRALSAHQSVMVAFTKMCIH